MARNKKEDVTFSLTEYETLESDLAKVVKALREGHNFALSELKTIYNRITEKRILQKEYAQVIKY